MYTILNVLFLVNFLLRPKISNAKIDGIGVGNIRNEKIISFFEAEYRNTFGIKYIDPELV